MCILTGNFTFLVKSRHTSIGLPLNLSLRQRFKSVINFLSETNVEIKTIRVIAETLPRRVKMFMKELSTKGLTISLLRVGECRKNPAIICALEKHSDTFTEP